MGGHERSELVAILPEGEELEHGTELKCIEH
jgi:hypothetical protein